MTTPKLLRRAAEIMEEHLAMYETCSIGDVNSVATALRRLADAFEKPTVAMCVAAAEEAMKDKPGPHRCGGYADIIIAAIAAASVET